MQTAISYFPTETAVPPDVMARMVEQRGHAGIYFAEHTHIPVGHSTAPNGTELGSKYSHTHDLFVAMTAAVTATTRLRVGSSICLLIQRDPIVTAKAIASLDVLSGGRIDVGVGAGWNRQEMANHGTDPRVRMAILRERVEAMTAIWTQDVASYRGDHVHFDDIWSWPKPAQRPRPPVLIGGSGPTVLDRVLDFGDGWIPNNAHTELPRIAELQRRAAEAGRDVVVYGMDAPPDPSVLEQLANAGVKQAIHWAPSAGPGVVERDLDRFEQAVADFTGT